VRLKDLGKGIYLRMIKLLKSHKTGYFSPTLRFFQGGENLFGFSSNPGDRKGRACWPKNRSSLPFL